MELSCKSVYTLLALLELVPRYHTGEPVQIRQIAAQRSIPDRYLEQLLATLRRCQLVRSQRGAKGGYVLAREPWKITLLEAIQCIDGTDDQNPDLGLTHKTPEVDVVKEIWQEARQAAELVLQNYTLQDLAERCDIKKQHNIMYYI